MRKIIYVILILFSVASYAQEENIFLKRSFWKNKPTVSEIKQKIKEGHSPTEKNSFAFDAVSYGIISDAPVESIKYLLTLEGNPVSKPTHGKITYLLWAAFKGNEDMIKHLISLGADANTTTSGGTNMLLMAAVGGVENKNVYDIILNQGIDVNHKNDSGANVLLTLSASKAKDLSIFNYFIDKGVSIKSKDNDGNNLFSYAARGGNLEVMKMWVDKGVEYKGINKKGENAVLYASKGMRRRALDIAVFSYLSKDLGLEVDQVNREGKTPLHFGVRRAKKDLIAFFIANGVSANQIDNNGNTALINAVSNSTEKLELLLLNTKNISHKNNKGQSALTKAVQRRSRKAFDMLIANNAKVDVLDKDGNNLLYYVFSSFRKGKEEDATYFINELQKRKVALPNQDKDGNNLVHIAVKKHSPFLLEKAIALGANVNHQNNLNLSPLHLAAMKEKNKELLSVLLKMGADKKLKTNFNESAYDLAMENELLREQKVNLGFLKLD